VSSCLVLLLETQLKIFVTPDCPATRLSLAHRVLAEETTGDTNGFYDVLRSHDGRVIGIRYTVGAGFDSLLNAVPKLPYAQVKGRQQSMELFFSRERQCDPHKSTDQLFGDDRVFRSGSLYAMTFGLGDLPEVDACPYGLSRLCRYLAQRLRPAVLRCLLEKGPNVGDQIDGKRENHSRVLLGTNLCQGLQIPKLDTERLLTHDVSCL